ncbi:hypothetical protein D6833_02780, partial [Candidatus Parcubacteria bacterium]
APSKNKGTTADVKVGAFTKVSAEINVRLWGPFKVFGKLEGSWTQQGGVENLGGDQTSGVFEGELEVSLMLGIEADFVFLKIFAGVEGKIKFVVDGALAALGPRNAMVVGTQDFLNWWMARKLAMELGPKVEQAKKTVGNKKKQVDSEFGRLFRKIDSGDWAGELEETSWYQFWKSDTVVDKVDDHLADIEDAVKDAFSDFDVKTDPLGRGLGRKYVLTKLAAVASAPNKQKAHTLAMAAKKDTDTRIDQMLAQIDDVKNNQIKSPENNEAVGFEGSVALKGGAKVGATKKLSGEVTVATAWVAKDEKGKNKWSSNKEDYELERVHSAELKVTVGDVEVKVSYEGKKNEDKFGLSAYMEKVKFLSGLEAEDPGNIRDFGLKFGKAFRESRALPSFLGTQGSLVPKIKQLGNDVGSAFRNADNQSG